MPFPDDAALPQDSLVLVTGLTGYIASVIADQLLLHGYRVRGTARDPSNTKTSWMPAYFDKKYGEGRFELVQVEDLAKDGCLDAAIKDCAGVIHPASIVQFDADPHKVIEPSIRILDNVLAAIGKGNSVKRLVLTSSSSAVSPMRMDEISDLTVDMWANWSVEIAQSPPPCSPERPMINYAASKVLTEQKLWQYAKDVNSDIVCNSVLPDFNLGPPVKTEKQGLHTSMAFFKEMCNDSGSGWRMFKPQWCIDVVDTALLHIAALAHPEVKNERIFGYAHTKTWKDFIRRLKVMFPDHAFPEPNKDDEPLSVNVVPQARAETLLKWMGQPGWRPLDDTLRESFNAIQ